MVVHTHASYPLGHLTTAAWIGLRAGDKHYNISQPGWAKFAWSSMFAPLNFGATVFVYKPNGRWSVARHTGLSNYHTLCTADSSALIDTRRFARLPIFLARMCQRRRALERRNHQDLEGRNWDTIADGYGQTESTCMICNLPDSHVKFGSMRKPAFIYDTVIADEEGNCHCMKPAR